MLTVADIRRALFANEQREERAMWDEWLDTARKRAQPPLKNAGVERAAEESDFARFEDFTRKLVNVPKREIDEKRKDES
ncbi:MAG: hypothetical protein H0V22_08370 [Solirubrobacterales bacterium]|nr:hypothetical protein [Solirubrobacterales bacterium]